MTRRLNREKKIWCGLSDQMTMIVFGFRRGGKEQCIEDREFADCKTDCDFKYWNNGVAVFDMEEFSNNEALWLSKFKEAWNMATENGQ